MCQLTPPQNSNQAGSTGVKPAFSCSRLNSTTFILKENDKWGESPLIYAKVYKNDIVLIDSGCGGSLNTPDCDVTLRVFLETVPVPENGGDALNPSGAKRYTIICTHCHFDHIGGLSEFKSNSIWASSLGKPYMTDPSKLSVASLSCYVGMKLPEFTVTQWASDSVHVTAPGVTGYGEHKDLGLVIYQTPGHMPDQVAIWDPEERVLYVGDTLYETAPILFPEGSSFFAYKDTISKLRILVKGWNAEAGAAGRVKLAAGHITYDVDADGLLEAAHLMVNRVLASEIEAIEMTDEVPYFGGQPAVKYESGIGGLHFMGLRKSFEHLC
ncbi:hypothetical protein NW768_012043 [Fusarium equiseti]|uniref:Metallo-beta-lactamase domain-containing protein n=1 Tax=Fusarium equiseti TaxID=61235 RepID=A0ABQ8QVZ2_FUSEQ|nr:hypothetical protein NW768_012043 [Fusarium equiseti]